MSLIILIPAVGWHTDRPNRGRHVASGTPGILRCAEARPESSVRPHGIEALIARAISALDRFLTQSFVAIDCFPLSARQIHATVQHCQPVVFLSGEPLFLEDRTIEIEPDGHRGAAYRLIWRAIAFKSRQGAIHVRARLRRVQPEPSKISASASPAGR